MSSEKELTSYLKSMFIKLNDEHLITSYDQYNTGTNTSTKEDMQQQATESSSTAILKSSCVANVDHEIIDINNNIDTTATVSNANTLNKINGSVKTNNPCTPSSKNQDDEDNDNNKNEKIGKKVFTEASKHLVDDSKENNHYLEADVITNHQIEIDRKIKSDQSKFNAQENFHSELRQALRNGSNESRKFQSKKNQAAENNSNNSQSQNGNDVMINKETTKKLDHKKLECNTMIVECYVKTNDVIKIVASSSFANDMAESTCVDDGANNKPVNNEMNHSINLEKSSGEESVESGVDFVESGNNANHKELSLSPPIQSLFQSSKQNNGNHKEHIRLKRSNNEITSNRKYNLTLKTTQNKPVSFRLESIKEEKHISTTRVSELCEFWKYQSLIQDKKNQNKKY